MSSVFKMVDFELERYEVIFESPIDYLVIPSKSSKKAYSNATSL